MLVQGVYTVWFGVAWIFAVFSHVFHVGFYSQTLRIGVVAGYATGLVNTVPLACNVGSSFAGTVPKFVFPRSWFVACPWVCTLARFGFSRIMSQLLGSTGFNRPGDRLPGGLRRACARNVHCMIFWLKTRLTLLMFFQVVRAHWSSLHTLSNYDLHRIWVLTDV